MIVNDGVSQLILFSPSAGRSDQRGFDGLRQAEKNHCAVAAEALGLCLVRHFFETLVRPVPVISYPHITGGIDGDVCDDSAWAAQSPARPSGKSQGSLPRPGLPLARGLSQSSIRTPLPASACTLKLPSSFVCVSASLVGAEGPASQRLTTDCTIGPPPP